MMRLSFCFVFALFINTSRASEFYSQPCALNFSQFKRQLERPQPLPHSPVEVLLYNLNSYMVDPLAQERISREAKLMWKIINTHQWSVIYALHDLFSLSGRAEEIDYPIRHYVYAKQIDAISNSDFQYGAQRQTPRTWYQDPLLREIEALQQYDERDAYQNRTHTLILLGGPGYAIESQIESLISESPKIKRLVIPLSGFYSYEIEQGMFRSPLELIADGQLLAKLVHANIDIHPEIHIGEHVVNGHILAQKWESYQADGLNRLERDHFYAKETQFYVHALRLLTQGQDRISLRYLSDSPRRLELYRWPGSIQQFLLEDTDPIPEHVRSIIFVDSIE